jgi:integrase
MVQRSGTERTLRDAMRVPGLQRRGNRLVLRVAVPPDLRQTIGKYEIVKSLGTADEKVAAPLARLERVKIDRLFKAARERGVEGTVVLPDGGLQRLARQVYEARLADYTKYLESPPEKDRANLEDLSDAFSPEIDHLALGLSEGIWWDHVEDAIDAELQQRGAVVPRGTPAYTEASRLIARALIAAQVTAKRRAKGDFGYIFNDPIATSPAPSSSITVKELIDRYQRDKGGAWSRKTRDGYTLIFRALAELLGEDRPVKMITRDDCRRLKDVLVDLTPNYTKREGTRGKSMEEAARIARELGLPRLQAQSINSYLNNLAALFNFAAAEDFIAKSPATKLQVPSDNKGKPKHPFSLEQLRAIFSAPLYTGCVDDAGGYGIAGPRHPRRGRFWVPLLSLWTGMRLNECCQLLVDDVRTMDGVPCIVITEDAEDGVDDKRVKTEAGERYVPVHPELIKIGFMDHWRKTKDSGERRLFSDLPLGKGGYYSDPFQKWFRRFLDKAGASKARTSFHSFRHSYRDALREAGIYPEVAKALGGWAATETQEEYGAGLRPKTLYNEICKVRYEGLDLSHLHKN